MITRSNVFKLSALPRTTIGRPDSADSDDVVERKYRLYQQVERRTPVKSWRDADIGKVELAHERRHGRTPKPLLRQGQCHRRGRANRRIERDPRRGVEAGGRVKGEDWRIERVGLAD